jgi:outer membrane biosynthesis protein TonB
MLVWLAFLAVAHGEPTQTELEPGAFEAIGTADRIAVTRLAVPEGIAAEADDRLCRVRFTASEPGPMTPAFAECPPGLQAATEAAMEAWTVTLDRGEPAASPASAALEVWVRFGVAAREVPEIFVRGDWSRELTLPSGVGGMPLYAAELGRPVFPEQALADGVLGASCTVEVEVSHRGYLLSDPVVSGCEGAFADAVVAAAKRWRFKAPRLGQEPSTLASNLGVVFEAVPGSVPGELEGKVEVVVPGSGEKLVVRQGPRQVKSGIPSNAEPLLVLDHDPYAAVEIMGWVWPDVDDASARCDLLVQVDSRRRVMVWPESCPEGLVEPMVAAVSQWSLRPGTIEPGERYGRFRAALVVQPGAQPHLVVPENDVVAVGEDVAGRVHTFREAVTKSRVPPKMPKGLSGPEECTLKVEIAPSGKPSLIEALACSDASLAEAKKAVKQWRWEPAREDGKPQAWQTTVKLTFAGG